MSAFRGGQWVLVVILVAGLVVAWRGLTWTEFTRRGAAPFALLVGAGVFLLITSVGRAGLPGASYRSRYIDLTLALTLPALAVAADVLIRRWRVLAIPIVVVLLLGVPSNLRAVANYTKGQAADARRYRQTVFALPRLPLAARVPQLLEPLPGITIGWLRAGAASGRIPAPGTVTPAEAATDELRLSLRTRTAHPLRRGRAVRSPGRSSSAFAAASASRSRTAPCAPSPPLAPTIRRIPRVRRGDRAYRRRPAGHLPSGTGGARHTRLRAETVFAR